MDIRQKNIIHFSDTLERISKSRVLSESLEKSKAAQEVILESDSVAPPSKLPRMFPAKVKVTGSSSFDAARRYSGKVCVLNFASATNPGGGVTNGSSAQEECLCRCSTLYGCLNSAVPMQKFYGPHRDSLGPLHNDDIIYTPDVVVIKSDSYTPLWQNTVVDVLTCAAPNLRERPGNLYNQDTGRKPDISPDELYDIHIKHARRILSVAASHGVDALILGAFGCGAFKNDPAIVARAYKDAIFDYINWFDFIEFAVYTNGNTENYDRFKEIMTFEQPSTAEFTYECYRCKKCKPWSEMEHIVLPSYPPKYICLECNGSK